MRTGLVLANIGLEGQCVVAGEGRVSVGLVVPLRVFRRVSLWVSYAGLGVAALGGWSGGVVRCWFFCGLCGVVKKV